MIRFQVLSIMRWSPKAVEEGSATFVGALPVLRGAHGLSCAITAWRGDTAHTLLFDTVLGFGLRSTIPHRRDTPVT